MFELFANLIALHIDAQQRLMASESALATERERAEFQDQFIAVLGHDLRSSVTAIQMCAKVLATVDADDRAARVAEAIDQSAGRMEELIENILDFARARLGGGLPIVPVADSGLQGTFEQIVAEMKAAHPTRTIASEIHLTRPIYGDRLRLGQLLSNLLANALTHGDPDGVVSLHACTGEKTFQLSVANPGEPMPPQTIRRLFQPFTRSVRHRRGDGLGLGLYIASQIALAHRGTLDVTSSDRQTVFTFRMPVNSAPRPRRSRRATG
jgi:signal transduction histidine kinase